jgi:chromosome segregation ATPase
MTTTDASFFPAPASDAASPVPSIAPQSELGAGLRADYEALHNDLIQAQELAADFQRQLAGKSNEVAHFKHLLEKTHTDLNQLERRVQQMREDRHKLANDAMRYSALEAEVEQLRRECDALRSERDTLRKEIEVIRAAGTTRIQELMLVSEEQQREIARLRAVLEVLKRRGKADPADAPEMRQQIVELTHTIMRLQEMLALQSMEPVAPKSPDRRNGSHHGNGNGKGADSEFIEIAFDT